MRPRIGQVLAVCSIVVFLGCGSRPAGRSTLSTTVAGREVKASLDGPGFITAREDSATISFAGGKLIIEKSAVRLEGEELAKVPEEAKKVEVDYTAGKLTVSADGKAIATRELRK
jgi:hypothetical protein